MNEDCMRHGAFGWNELMTTDVEGARKFYSALFGWQTEPAPMEGMAYTVIKIAGDPIGGMMRLPAECRGMPPCWGVYVSVGDVDAVAARVAALGGKLVRPPEDIPGVGRFCVIQDPQGAALCAMTWAKR